MSKVKLAEQVQDFRAGHKHLVRYIKQKPSSKDQRQGVIVTFKDEESGTIRFGWSVCNPKDSFSKDVGFVKAVSNSKEIAYHDSNYPRETVDALVSANLAKCEVPEWIREQSRSLMTRAYIYYKLVPSQSPKG